MWLYLKGHNHCYGCQKGVRKLTQFLIEVVIGP
jgi:hypothetical protein